MNSYVLVDFGSASEFLCQHAQPGSQIYYEDGIAVDESLAETCHFKSWVSQPYEVFEPELQQVEKQICSLQADYSEKSFEAVFGVHPSEVPGDFPEEKILIARRELLTHLTKCWAATNFSSLVANILLPNPLESSRDRFFVLDSGYFQTDTDCSLTNEINAVFQKHLVESDIQVIPCYQTDVG